MSAPPTPAYANSHANPPPPPLSMAGGPPQQGPSVLQILAMGQERNHAADAMAHHPRIESLIKLGKESEATWLQIGQTAEAMGDLDRAVASYEAALRHNAYSVVALSQIAAICRSKEEFKKAAEYFGRVVGIAPESGDVWGALGHCYLMIDDLKKAYSSYQQALYYMPNPHEPKLWYGIGILYDRYGSLEHAEEAFSSVIRMDPNFEKSNEIFFRLGIIYKQQRKSAQSLECFRYILNNPPRPLTEIDIWFQIGHVYEQQKDFIAAKESYERVLQENPAHAKVLQQLGGLYHRSRAPFYNPEISVQILTKSLESDPNDPFSWYLLGRAYMTTNNFGKAYEAYQQAVYRDGKNPAFWCSIGVLYYNINQFHDALDAYSRAIRIHPYLAEVWFNLGALYEACNDQMTDAIDAYQRTLQLDPANQIVAQRLREIREHQASGAPLSPPPPPKDISPSSLSWNYATNAGGAPTALAQTGLGPELSPTMTANGAAGTRSTAGGSPLNGGTHRFEGQPPNTAGSRPRSTDPYHRLGGGDERRRASGGHAHHSPSGSIDQSPRTLSAAGPGGPSRLSGPGSSILPQIKNLQDVRPSSNASPRSRAGSPPSPRTRPPESSGPSDRYPPHGGYPFPSHLSQSHPAAGPSSAHRPGENGVYEMDWERSGRASANGRNGAVPGRHPLPHSPPGSSHSTSAGLPPPHPAHMFDRAPTGPPGGPRHFFDNPASGPPGAGGYGYPGSQSGPAGPMAYQREREAAEEYARRRSSGSTSASRVSVGGAPTPTEQPGTAPLPLPEAVAAPPAPAPTGRGRGGGRGKKDDGEGAVKKEPAKGGRKAKAKDANASEGGEVTPKKERKTKAAREKEAAAKAAAVLNGVANVARAAAPPPPPAPAPSAPPPAGQSPSPPQPAQQSNAPNREVDEDYDEGVDALMNLAASGSTAPGSAPSPSAPAPASTTGSPSPSVRQPSPPPPPPPASLAPPAPAPSTASEPSPAPASAATSPNPRKRSLPPPDGASTNGAADDVSSTGEPEAKKSRNESPVDELSKPAQNGAPANEDQPTEVDSAPAPAHEKEKENGAASAALEEKQQSEAGPAPAAAAAETADEITASA
ncbi:hypothetical protein JCM1840_005668 [Sporobolomyces johnsonii]